MMKTKDNKMLFIYCTLFFTLLSISTDLQSQDYLIDFAATGESTEVNSVLVENLTRGTILNMNGDEILKLNVITHIENPKLLNSKNINFFPNPMTDYCRMRFVLPSTGETTINLYDVSGRKISGIAVFLQAGEHLCVIRGVSKGIYFVRIISGQFSSVGRLMALGSDDRRPEIKFENTSVLPNYLNDSKGWKTEKIMEYSQGECLKFTGTTADYCTVVTDVPLNSKTIVFDFMACTDIDGNNYPIVQIGTQVWMAENLKVTRYEDGNDIPYVTENAAWDALSSAGFCWYDNQVDNKEIYGGIYNWYAVATNKICPSGWHEPSDDEWIVLVNYLGGESIAGGKLKETGTSHWKSPNSSALNTSGFSALPGGLRSPYGIFNFINSSGFWWTETETFTTGSYNREISYLTDLILKKGNAKENGFSVRCIKD